jgi:hypothetical protein
VTTVPKCFILTTGDRSVHRRQRLMKSSISISTSGISIRRTWRHGSVASGLILKVLRRVPYRFPSSSINVDMALFLVFVRVPLLSRARKKFSAACAVRFFLSPSTPILQVPPLPNTTKSQYYDHGERRKGCATRPILATEVDGVCRRSCRRFGGRRCPLRFRVADSKLDLARGRETHWPSRSTAEYGFRLRMQVSSQFLVDRSELDQRTRLTTDPRRGHLARLCR